MSSTMTPYGPDMHVHKSRYTLHRVCELTALGLVYASVVGLTGCATSAEVESLRAEIAKANATAARAQVEVSRTQRELAVLKAAAKPPKTFYKPGTPPAAPLTKPGGYKWGVFQQY